MVARPRFKLILESEDQFNKATASETNMKFYPCLPDFVQVRVLPVIGGISTSFGWYFF